MKKNILKHTATSSSYPQIQPSKKFVPEWYKDSPKFFDGITEKNIKSLPLPMSFKMCSVFSETFFTGYTIPLPVDIAIEQTEGGPKITWNSSIADQFIDLRINDKSELPTPLGCSSLHFVWLTKHIIKIPKGYSALLTHPLNRHDLPFITLSGIADGEFVMHNGNIPVYFSSSFEGIISAGTPIIQVLLFKSENWDNEIDENLIPKAKENENKSQYSAYGWYKKNIWKKKTYN